MRIHMVKKGDTLSSIAKKHNIELNEILALNPEIADPNQITVGMKIKLPNSPKPIAHPSHENAHQHVVSQGDSIWKLSKAWNIPLNTLIAANPQLKNPNVLLTGDIVYIPKHDAQVHQQGSNGKANTAPMMPVETPMTTVSPDVQPPKAEAPELSSLPDLLLPELPELPTMPMTETTTYSDESPMPEMVSSGVPIWNAPQPPSTTSLTQEQMDITFTTEFQTNIYNPAPQQSSECGCKCSDSPYKLSYAMPDVGTSMWEQSSACEPTAMWTGSAYYALSMPYMPYESWQMSYPVTPIMVQYPQPDMTPCWPDYSRIRPSGTAEIASTTPSTSAPDSGRDDSIRIKQVDAVQQRSKPKRSGRSSSLHKLLHRQKKRSSAVPRYQSSPWIGH